MTAIITKTTRNAEFGEALVKRVRLWKRYQEGTEQERDEIDKLVNKLVVSLREVNLPLLNVIQFVGAIKRLYRIDGSDSKQAMVGVMDVDSNWDIHFTTFEDGSFFIDFKQLLRLFGSDNKDYPIWLTLMSDGRIRIRQFLTCPSQVFRQCLEASVNHMLQIIEEREPHGWKIWWHGKPNIVDPVDDSVDPVDDSVDPVDDSVDHVDEEEEEIKMMIFVRDKR